MQHKKWQQRNWNQNKVIKRFVEIHVFANLMLLLYANRQILNLA